ncbi:type IX secretion system sortase PorU [Urechidicola croceus]|uniref:Uncharacterized protein n=1 Tax=Urechidicola croceus TaxID=1850246 RepID=A0A1D8P6Y4_9FLAO|nr:type IX secretion system sortase PorU [Urechidicola croceus]AOW20312.1 hypothetical protein LPB138_06300 [Urechidicola croceus]
MNKIKIILFIAIISFTASYSQLSERKSINLDWVEEPIYTSEKNKIDIPTVKNQFLDDNLLPNYTNSWNVSNGYEIDSYLIKNVKYESLTSQFSKNIELNKISSDLKSDLSIAKSRNNSEVLLTLTPLVIQNGVLKKVISFDLEYSLKKSIANRTSRLNNRGYNSVLSTGDWYKFSIDTTGVFKINSSFLQSLGIDPSKINPKNIKVYGNGGAMLPFLNSEFRYDDLQENAIFVSGEEDNSFDSNDYILFYGRGPDAWDVNLIANEIRHKKNIFSDKSYYFITVDGAEGKRIENEIPITTSTNQVITTFDDHNFYEKEEFNLFSVGQQWFGENLTVENVQNFTIPFNNIDNSEDITVRVRGVVESSSSSQMHIKVNGQELTTISYPAVSLGSLILAFARENEGSVNISGNEVNVEVTFDNNGNPSAKAYLDYIEVIGKKKLVANGNQFGFRNFDINNNGIYRYEIQNGNNIAEVWNVTDPMNPFRVVNQSTNTTFSFNESSNTFQEYIALNQDDYFTPETLSQSKVDNQNLHALEDIDYVIVTQDFLAGEAERLADFHRAKGLTVEVVDLFEIYNEFSSGSPDLTAIRDFTKYLYNSASTPENRIKYLCLFGDASFDYKDRIFGNNNIVPAFLAFESFNLATSYLTDDYFAMLDENEGLLTPNNRQDVATGRIPVSDIVQASNVVDKIINYNSTNSYGDWRNLVTLISDDLDIASESVLQSTMEQIADSIKLRKPILNVKKIYADAFSQETSAGGERYPDVNTAISNGVETGTLMINYFGHGGQDGWAAERILEIPELQAWNNVNKQPLIITITCQFSQFDNPLRQAGGEYVIWSKNGGSSTLITTTREIYINVGRVFNDRLTELLLNFDNSDLTISEALMTIKNQFTTNQRLFIYSLGDPAMKLAVPKEDIRLTHMNDIEITESLDTIKALSHVSFRGIITDAVGNKLNDYNGELSATVYDKSINKTTLDNDNHGIVMEFDALESKIFRGRATVENGDFTFDFIAPKDLRIAYGNGKISFYADDDVIDKAGYNFDVVIGGINEDAAVDDEGPEIKLYMNDETFIDGGNTNSSPYLVAVLEDESGINTSITAVDHDIVAILDGDQANPVVLNDYYQTELNDFTKGKVNYLFRNLESGIHTLELCAWDTYNNSSCATLTFVVVNDSEMVLDNVLNYPNPFVNYTEFWFNHNKPNEALDVQVQIFTVSGKLVKTINQTVQSDGNLSRSITWNGLDDFGDKIGKGVYVYKLNVKSLLSNVKAEKYEKLVILQ